MKNEMVLSNGVRIEFTENGVNVIATDGELIRFDDNGELLRKEVFGRAENFTKYFDFMGPEERQIVKEWYINLKKKKIKKDSIIQKTKLYGETIGEAMVSFEFEGSFGLSLWKEVVDLLFSVVAS